MKKKVNYINNKDLLHEIHQSKLSYCYTLDEKYTDYDLILDSVKEISPENIELAKKSHARRKSSRDYERKIDEWSKSPTASKRDKPKQADFEIDPDSIKLEDIVFRVMTFEHVPLEPGRKKNPKTIADHHARCNFPPFKHYAYINGNWQEVLRSHWEGSLGNGHFSTSHGQMTNKLGNMILELCKRNGRKSNWRNYSYLEEMQNNAALQLSQVGLQFNESRGQNPFAYYTQVVENSFTRVLNLEKRNQDIRDDILQDSGYMPSFSRQMLDEADQQAARAEQEKIEKDEKELKDAGYNII